MHRAFHSPKGLGCCNSDPCFFTPKKQFRALRRVPITVCQPSTAELHANAQSPHGTSTVPHSRQRHPQNTATPRPAPHGRSSHRTFAYHGVTNDSSYAPTPPTQPHPAAPLQMHFPPAHTQISASNLHDYGPAQPCLPSHPVCSPWWQSHGNLAHHWCEAQHWSSRAKSTLVTHPLSHIVEYDSGGHTGLA